MVNAIRWLQADCAAGVSPSANRRMRPSGGGYESDIVSPSRRGGLGWSFNHLARGSRRGRTGGGGAFVGSRCFGEGACGRRCARRMKRAGRVALLCGGGRWERATQRALAGLRRVGKWNGTSAQFSILSPEFYQNISPPSAKSDKKENKSVSKTLSTPGPIAQILVLGASEVSR